MKVEYKVAMIGNICGLPYQYAKNLRKKGIDVDLFIVHNGTIFKSADPRWEDDLARFPKWIIPWNTHNPFSLLKTLLLDFKKYDLIHAFTVSPMYCQYAGKPYIATSTGADIREMAVSPTFTGRLLAKGYKDADINLFNNPDLLKNYRELGIAPKFLPFMINWKRIKSVKKIVKEKDRFVVFHPARWDWRSKGTDIVLKAFKEFSYKHKDAVLKLIDNPSNSYDKEKTLKLLTDLDLDKKVIILPFLDKADLIAQFKSVDVVIEQIAPWIGSFGLTTIEAMACGRPLIHCADEKLVKQCYGEMPPLMNASSVHDVAKALEQLYSSERLRKQVGEGCLKWAQKHHDTAKITDDLIGHYENVLKKNRGIE
jgi:glycosyltransferase involved in cell wall biosynthesis